jgi:nicotinamidase-related amidase
MDSGDRFKDRMDELRAGYDPSEGISRHWGADTEAFYEERGLGGRTGFGARPGLLVIDMARAFNDPSFKVGADQTPAVEAIAKLLPAARSAGIPIYFVVTAYHRDGRDAGMFGRKIPALLELQLDEPAAMEVDERIQVQPGEHVIVKKFASSFFGTNLASLLTYDRVDTLILTGCSTSGCIRAAAIDGVSHGFRVVVPEEAVSDRAEGPHHANLFDINAKYGDVVALDEVVGHLAGREVARA